MKTNFSFLSLGLVFVLNVLYAQPTIDWQRCLGGTRFEANGIIQQTTDGGYISAGLTFSNDGDASGNHSSLSDVWVVKLNPSGDIDWQKCLGGTREDLAIGFQQTNDGGYIVVGQTASNNGDVNGNHSSFYSDGWVVKLSSTGNIQWQKCLGGTGYDINYSIQNTTDGGFVVSGQTESNDGDVSGNHGSADGWVVKLGSTGNTEWQKCLGGTGGEYFDYVLQTLDSGYVVVGSTGSNDGDVSGNHGGSDGWVVKLGSTGNTEWQKCLGGTGGDGVAYIQQTTDGGFVVVGGTGSNDGDVSGNHGGGDGWVVKLGSNGNIQWQKCLGGTGQDGFAYIQNTTDGGFVVSGGTKSNNEDVSGNHGDEDIWVVKLSAFTGTTLILNSYREFLVFPNPITGSANLKTEPAFVGKSFQVFNAQGKLVLIGKISAEEMPMSTEGLPAGIYTMSAAGYTTRIVKE